MGADEDHSGVVLERVQKKIESLDFDKSIKKDMLKSFKLRLDTFSNDVLFFNEPFTPVSITGTDCELNCKHCEKHYLKHMLDASGDKLDVAIGSIAKRGHSGVLISGGSKLDGSVATYELSGNIADIKEKTHLKMSAHTGIINRQQAQSLSTWLDMALVDCIGSNETISRILGLSNTVSDYENTLKFLTGEGIPIAPHIIVGLNDGALDGEFEAIEMVQKYDPDVVVIVVFIPTKGTAGAGSKPPALEDVAAIVAKARQAFPKTPLSLSCVRPGGRYRTQLDECAILCGIDRIAVPSRSAYRLCNSIGLDIQEVGDMCCSYNPGD